MVEVRLADSSLVGTRGATEASTETSMGDPDVRGRNGTGAELPQAIKALLASRCFKGTRRRKVAD